jgi:hypothetical protein
MASSRSGHTLSVGETAGVFQLGPAHKIDMMISQDKQHVGFSLHLDGSLFPSGIPIEFFVDTESAMALMQTLQEMQRQFGLSTPKIATTTTRVRQPQRSKTYPKSPTNGSKT